MMSAVYSSAREVNFDAIVGPTHAYAGLAMGNLASQRHKHAVSHPRQAALQGLAKMKLLADLGIPQAVLPPQRRPDLDMLRRLGFSGDDAAVLSAAGQEDPGLLAASSSASAMWAANAATVSPSADTADGKVHFTPANLVSQFHRSIETRATAAILRVIFPDSARFVHHPALPACLPLGDEGAANHARLTPSYGQSGLEVFVYGRDESSTTTNTAAPRRFPARQSRAAAEAIARLHGLDPARTLFLRQNPEAIDAGVFHNDVICVGNEDVLLVHERAFAGGAADLNRITEAYQAVSGQRLHLITIPESALSLSESVETYLFNSQLVTAPDRSGMRLIAPIEVRDHPSARRCVEQVLADSANPVNAVTWVDVRQSMNNGGGPACLRLRVVLTEAELASVRPDVFLNDSLYAMLTDWITRQYRERLAPGDLADPRLLQEVRRALDELSQILRIDMITAA